MSGLEQTQVHQLMIQRSWRLNLNREGLPKEPWGLKKTKTESSTGVALNRLALFTLGGSWTVSPALTAEGGDDQVTLPSGVLGPFTNIGYLS